MLYEDYIYYTQRDEEFYLWNLQKQTYQAIEMKI